MYTIENHMLMKDGCSVAFAYSPNFSGPLEPLYIILHYTAGWSAEGAVSWLCNPDARASAHLVIARDAEITQLVPFSNIAWHAGKSQWENYNWMNAYSIGIEIDNAGKLTWQGNAWTSWWGKAYTEDEIGVAEHKNGGGMLGWHTYPQEQILTTLDVCVRLARHYDIKDILGHDDVSPGRKTDPGPLFPMASFKARVMGRRDCCGG